MKHMRILQAVALALVASAVSCVSIDEKLVTGVSSQYYSTPDGLNSALVASYAQLRSFYGKEQLLSLTQVGTDTWQAGDQSGSNNQHFDAYDGHVEQPGARAGEHVESRVPDDQHAERGARSRAEHARAHRGDEESPAR